MTENNVSIVLTVEETTQAKNALLTLKESVGVKTVTLTNKQRQELPKMGDGTMSFVTKTLEYGRSNPEFAPPYIDMTEFEIDLKAVEELRKIYIPLAQLLQQIDDSILLSGSEAYVAALAYYNSVKMGAKMNVPGAKTIFEDLKHRFVKNTSSPSSDSGDQEL